MKYKIKHNGKTYTEASPSSIWRENQKSFRYKNGELIRRRKGFIITLNNDSYPGIKVWGQLGLNTMVIEKGFNTLADAINWIDSKVVKL